MGKSVKWEAVSARRGGEGFAMIEEYLNAFESHLIGTSVERAEWRAELASHLQQAEQAGDLDGALHRLGSPREAAAAFRTARPLRPAPISPPVRPAMIDHALVAAVTASVRI